MPLWMTFSPVASIITITTDVVVVVVYLHDNIRIQQNYSRKHQTCQAKQDPQEKLLNL